MKLRFDNSTVLLGTCNTYGEGFDIVKILISNLTFFKKGTRMVTTGFL
jgi:hypothetical protein